MRVVVFDISGMHGEEVTRALAIKLNKSGRTAIRASDEDTTGRPEVRVAANLTRRLEAQAFVFGNIVSAGRAGTSHYVIRGQFNLYDENGLPLGGVAQAKYDHDVDPLLLLEIVLVTPVELLRAIFDPDSESLYDKIIKHAKEKAEAAGPEVAEKLGACVARLLEKGLLSPTAKKTSPAVNKAVIPAKGSP